MAVLAGGEVTIQGGSVLGGMTVLDGGRVEFSRGDHDNMIVVQFGESEVEVSGGRVGGIFEIYDNSSFSVTGGEVTSSISGLADSSIRLASGKVQGIQTFAELDILGGHVGGTVGANGDSRVKISGGVLEEGLIASVGSSINLLGRRFEIDGVAVPGLEMNRPTLIMTGSFVLNGILADGTAFAYSFGTPIGDNNPVFSGPGEFTLTLIPEPNTGGLLAMAIITGFRIRRVR